MIRSYQNIEGRFYRLKSLKKEEKMKLKLFFEWLIVSCLTIVYLAGLLYFSKILGRLISIDYGVLFFAGLVISGICLLIVKVSSEKQSEKKERFGSLIPF